MVFKYKVARVSEYLAIMGCGISDVKLTKKAWVLPGQRCIVFDICPINYELEVKVMSSENLPLYFSIVFTVGPHHEDSKSLLRYVKCIFPQNIKGLVSCIIKGETWNLTTSMTMKEVSRDTIKFKEELFKKVQTTLSKYGLLIYNISVEQSMVMRKKTQHEAAKQAKVGTIEARMHGEIGVKESLRKYIQNIAKVEKNVMELQRVVEEYENLLNNIKSHISYFL